MKGASLQLKVWLADPFNDLSVEADPFYRRLVTPTSACMRLVQFYRILGLAISAGLVWYAYMYPTDRDTYYHRLENPTAYELETLTPKQVTVFLYL